MPDTAPRSSCTDGKKSQSAAHRTAAAWSNSIGISSSNFVYTATVLSDNPNRGYVSANISRTSKISDGLDICKYSFNCDCVLLSRNNNRLKPVSSKILLSKSIDTGKTGWLCTF